MSLQPVLILKESKKSYGHGFVSIESARSFLGKLGKNATVDVGIKKLLSEFSDEAILKQQFKCAAKHSVAIKWLAETVKPGDNKLEEALATYLGLRIEYTSEQNNK